MIIAGSFEEFMNIFLNEMPSGYLSCGTETLINENSHISKNI